jgi:hypothetical protein
MRVTTYASLLSALCGTVSAAAFFTEPEQGSSLNISAPITLKWNKPEIPDTREDDWRFLQITMRFEMPYAEERRGGTSWNEEIGTNLTLSRGGELEWDPSDVREFLEKEYNETADNPFVQFYAVITGPADGLQSMMEPGEHEIIGFGGKEGSAMAVLPVWLLVAAGVLVAI